MARPAKLSTDAALDAALAVIYRHGPDATTAAIAAEAGVRVGSLYYRFPNREVLLLRLWVRSVQRFQKHYLAAIRAEVDPEQALVAAAVSIPSYCRGNPEEARALTLFRHHEVLLKLEAQSPDLAECSEELVDQLRTLNDEVLEAMAALTVARFGSMDALEVVKTAVHDMTYGLVRPYLAAGAPLVPSWLDALVAAMVPAAFAAWDSR